MTNHRVDVALGDRSYSVLVGHGVINQIEALLPKSAKRAVVITQNNIVLQPELRIPSTAVMIGDGEEHKNLQTIEMLAQKFAEFGLTRN
ncbi:MAG: 3-dehydroquinate synthase, partial [Acidimicrobiaceae bacterium]